MTIVMTTTKGRGDSRPYPLLFVHGAWQAGWCWKEHFTEWFADRGWTSHTLDLRHHGASGGARSLRRTRIADYVADLAEAVGRVDRPPALVAHSMGGLIAQRYLETHDLPGCVLMAPVPLGGVWRATLKVLAAHPFKFLQANVVLDLKPLVDTPRMARDLLFDPDVAEADVVRYAARLQSESYLAYLDMMLVTRPRPPLVHTPVSLLIGDRDGLFSLRSIQKTAGAYGVEAAVIPGAGHQLMIGPRWEHAAHIVERMLTTF